jgi:TrpR-related protein YerC/YecD
MGRNDVNDGLDFMFAALSTIHTSDELGRFLEDWLTPRELEELTLRLDIARRLNAGQTYEIIQADTGASSTTISRVRRCLVRGAGGYRLVFNRLPRLTTP